MTTSTGKKPRDYMEMAYREMLDSVQDNNSDKNSPYVAAVLVFPDGSFQKAHRCHTRDGHHAEESLLDDMNSGKVLDDAELYVTLEPCVQEARSSDKIACVHRILDARIKKVYIGMYDPNPKVYMKGVQTLLDNGVGVQMFDADIREKIEKANRAFSNQFGSLESSEYRKIEKTVLPDLSDEAIHYFCKYGNIDISEGLGAFWDWLLNNGILKKSGGEYILLREGYFAFAKNTVRYCDSATTQLLVRLSADTLLNTTGKKYEYREDFSGPGILIVEQITSWAERYLPKEQNRSLKNTNMDFLVPFGCLKEAVVNAIVHRDYDEDTGSFIQVYISDNYLRISNPTKLTNSTLSELNAFKSLSNPINPRLARIFQLPRLMERSGSGMDTFSHAIPAPMYEYSSGILSLKFGYSEQNAFQMTQEEYGVQLSYVDYELFEFIRTKEMVSRKDVEKHFTIASSTAVNRINKLINLGMVCRMGSATSRHVTYMVNHPPSKK